MRGCFIGPNGRVAYYGLRSDKPKLEETHTFIEGLVPKSAQSDEDEYYYINGEWILQAGIHTPTKDQNFERAIPGEGGDPFKIIVFNALFELARQSRPDLTRAQYRKHLKSFL